MGKKIIQFVTGKDCELRERMFRTIIIVGGFATLLTIIENLLKKSLKGLACETSGL